MSSAYPPFGGVPARLCQRCGSSLPPNEVYCINCGYYNQSAGPGMEAAVQVQSPQNTPRAGNAQPPNGPDQSGVHVWPSSPIQGPIGQPPISPFPGPTGPNPQFPNLGNPFGPPIQPFSQPGNPGGPNSQGPSFGSGQYANPNSGLPMGAAPQYVQLGTSYGSGGSPSMAGNFVMPTNQFPGGGNAFGPPSTSQQPIGWGATASGMPSGFQMGGAPVPRAVAVAVPARRSARIGLFIGLMVLIVLLIGGGLTYIFLFANGTPDLALTGGNSPSNGPVVFADTFKNNDKGWDLQSEKGLYSASIDNGILTLEDNQNRLLPEYVPGTTTKPLTNFTLTVDAMLSKGDPNNGYGLYIRTTADQNSNPSSYYCIEFYGDSSYAVFKGAVDANGVRTQTKLIDYTASSAIERQGKINHISISANGALMTLLVNGQTLKTFTDNSYAHGAAALFVSNVMGTQGGAQAQFSNLEIYNG